MLWFTRINSLAVVLCLAVVVFGAFVRLSDAGLGCPDWPGCYGHLTVPAAPHARAAADQRYPQRPVEPAKAWKEMIHRYLATTLGLLITALALLSVALRGKGAPRVLPWVIFGTVLVQGALGALTVLWQVNPLTVTGHLLTGLTTLALLLWMRLSLAFPRAAPKASPAREPRNERQAWAALREQRGAVSVAAPRGLSLLAGLGLALLAGQIFLGGWTSSNYAALACPDFPTCQGSWLPDTDVHEAFTLWRGTGIDYQNGVLDSRARVTIHLFHRIGALTVTVALLLLAFALLRRKEALWQRLGLAVLAALVLQVTIGIGIVKLQLPLWLADLHNAGAALLLMVMVTVNYFTTQRQP